MKQLQPGVYHLNNGFRIIFLSGLLLISLLFSACSDNRADKLIQDLLTGDDNSRQRAAAALVEMGQPAVHPLTAALAHPNADARRMVLEVLRKIDDAKTARAPNTTPRAGEVPGITRDYKKFMELRHRMTSQKLQSGFPSRRPNSLTDPPLSQQAVPRRQSN
jgi:hypothetical protein